jgi:integrase
MDVQSNCTYIALTVGNMQINISNRTVSTMRSQDKPFEVRDTGLKGLLLRVQPSGVMTYYLEFKRGKRKKIGRADSITPVQARDIARTILASVYHGEDPTKKKRLADTYLDFLNSTYKPWLLLNLRTGAHIFENLKNNFGELHKLRLTEIDRLEIEKWRSRRQQEGLKPSSINRQFNDLRACLNRAFEWGMIDTMPVEKVKPFKVDNQSKVRFLSPDEEAGLRRELDAREKLILVNRSNANITRKEHGSEQLVDVADLNFVDHLKPAVLISLNTGVRRGELFSLKWRDVDLPHNILTVVGETAKSGKTRHVPMNIEASTIIQRWRTQCPLDETYVFSNKIGEPMHDARSSWSKVLSGAGIKDFRWHDLRHTFASKLVMAGVDLNTVRELLGHSDYKMTLRYAHLAPEHKAAAVGKLIREAVV